LEIGVEVEVEGVEPIGTEEVDSGMAEDDDDAADALALLAAIALRGAQLDELGLEKL